MKLLAFVACFLIMVSASFGQTKANYGFMIGTIYLKNGDSIVGLVEKQVAYGQTLAYKTSEYGATREIPVWQLKYFTAADKIYASYPLHNTVMLMEMIDSGKAAIYSYNEIKYGAAKRDYSTGLKTIKGDILVHYVVKLPTSIQEIKETEFKEQLTKLFSDCERMCGKIKRGDYLFEDMPEIVKDYNNCTGQYCTHAVQQSQAP